MQPRIVATIDTEGFYGTQGLNFITPTSNKLSVYYLLGILNSTLTNYLFSTKFLNLAIKAEYLKKLQIPIPSQETQENIISLSKNITAYNYDLEELRTKMVRLLKSDLELNKTSKKLENWHSLNYKQFIKELKKKKVEFKLEQESEWIDYFEEQKEKASQIKRKIKNSVSNLNEVVYQIYNLNEEEIRIVESEKF